MIEIRKSLEYDDRIANQRRHNGLGWKRGQFLVEPDQPPAFIERLVRDLRNAAKVIMKVPAPVDGEIHDVTHQQADPSLMAHEDNILISVRPLFFFQKACDALTCFFACFTLREAEVC